MQPTKGNALTTGQGGQGANAAQWGLARVSLPHENLLSQIGPFDPGALALAMMAAEDQTTDDEAVAALIAAGVPIEVIDMAIDDEEVVTHWALDWTGFLRSEDVEAWLVQFLDGLDEARAQATGADRLTLERIAFFFDAPENRTATTRRCLPTSAQYSAIAARTIKGANNGHRH
ncbi:MAG: hypothetical protein RBS10_11455 [Thauera propionica]|jgi:hypothetical protein|nr:hypothetical protein [Thauera propionica]